MLPAKDKFSSALYTFDIGQNDLTTGYKLGMTTEQVKAYVPDLISQFTTVIKVRCPTQFVTCTRFGKWAGAS